MAVHVTDPSSEITRMIELPHLYKNVYNKPFQVPHELNKEKNELDSEAIKVEISLLILSFSAFLKIFHPIGESEDTSSTLYLKE